MVQSSSGAGAAGGAPAADQPGSVRNVVLVGHSGAGKTTLVEALLAATGTIPRAGRVEDGTTVSDFDEAEQRQQRSVSLSLAPLTHAGVKVNLLDTPGYADFVGDLRAGLRAADAALFVVSAVDGVDGATRMLWEECAVGRHAARGRGHQAGQGPGRLRRGGGHLPARLRRRRAAALPPAGRRRRRRRRADRPAVAQRRRLLRRRAGRARARRRAPAADRHRPQRADRGHHRRVRGRDADGPLPRRRGHRPQGPRRRPGDRGRARVLLPRARGRGADRAGHRRAARGHAPRRSPHRWSTTCRR